MHSYDSEPAGFRRLLALAAARRVVLVDCDGDGTLAAALAESIGEDTALAVVLDRLAVDGLAQAPSFAVAAWDADGVTVVVRGDVIALVSSPAGETVQSAPAATSWTESRHAGATAVTLRGSAASAVIAPALPISSGAVWASSITALLSVRDGAAVAGVDAPIASPPVAGVPTAVEQAPATVVPAPAPDLTPAASDSESESDSDSESASQPLQTTAPEETQFFFDDDGSDTTVGAEPAASGEHTEAGYDYLFGQTVVRPVGAAAVPDEADDTEPSPGHAAADAAKPSAVETPAEPAEPLEPLEPLGDHDGHTIFAEDLAALRARTGVEPAQRPAAPVAAPRYFLELPEGRRHSLDVPIVIGRAPSVSQVPASVVPALVTVSGEDVSRSHVRVGVEGGTVVVTDLHSRNGTQVVLPGKTPQSLRPGEGTPVIVGTVIDLGGVLLRVREG
ncbi:FHA domain-containing protein [Plantibacter sp. Mn2098]|uniref:FHA domain-containing protein n=1 Tax=Plantibacter sp. Mn2098 TaxID=3395266 RepID=UPI003BE3A822